MDDKAAIRATIGPWTKAGVERDWDTLINMCTDDVVFAPPGEREVTRDRLRRWLESFPVMSEFNCEFERVEVNGPLATAVGHGNWTIEIDGKPVPGKFKFADVFKKSADGRWLYAHVIWNMDALSPES